MIRLKESRLAKLDVKNLHWLEVLYLFSIFINLLSLLVNAAAGNLIWVIIAIVCIAFNVWAFETHENDQ